MWSWINMFAEGLFEFKLAAVTIENSVFLLPEWCSQMCFYILIATINKWPGLIEWYGCRGSILTANQITRIMRKLQVQKMHFWISCSTRNMIFTVSNACLKYVYLQFYWHMKFIKLYKYAALKQFSVYVDSVQLIIYDEKYSFMFID